jgi:glycosyltransferase involved in cell wall biosynthesis
MRYAWWPETDERGAGWYAAPGRWVMRHWDRSSAAWVDRFAANSTFVADRIREVWGRDADVIHPPVWRIDPGRPVRNAADREGAVSVGRLIPYKRHDLAIAACRRLGVPLTIAGSGPDEARLRNLAGGDPLVRFETPDDDRLDELYAGARALLFCGQEDFGIVPPEAMSFGTPVCAYAAGGALDTVEDPGTGVLFDAQTEDAVVTGLTECLSRSWDHEHIADRSQRFSTAAFCEAASAWVDRAAREAGLTVATDPSAKPTWG